MGREVEICEQVNCCCDLFVTYALLRVTDVCVSVLKCKRVDIPHPHMIKRKIPCSDDELSTRLDQFELFNLFTNCPIKCSFETPIICPLGIVDVNELSDISEEDSDYFSDESG